MVVVKKGLNLNSMSVHPLIGIPVFTIEREDEEDEELMWRLINQDRIEEL